MEGLFVIGAIIFFVLVVRLFGAWILRIDEVIKYQKVILNELRDSTRTSEDEYQYRKDRLKDS